MVDGTPAAIDGSIQAGDEILAINNRPVGSLARQEVTRIIRESRSEIWIRYRKLHPDPKYGDNLDTIMTRFRKRSMDNMRQAIVYSLGVRRSLLANGL